jgi:hypothetical protein
VCRVSSRSRYQSGDSSHPGHFAKDASQRNCCRSEIEHELCSLIARPQWRRWLTQRKPPFIASSVVRGAFLIIREFLIPISTDATRQQICHRMILHHRNRKMERRGIF